MVFRVDLGTSLRPPIRLADGRVRVDALITRAGVFLYSNPDGSIRRELRDDSEVYAPESMRSFEQLPVTNLHPFEAVTADNARHYMVGANDSTIEKIVVDGIPYMRTMLMVADRKTIDEMDAKKKVQVSCGYKCDYVEEPGVHPKYGAYDGRQTNIRGNHIAMVPNARAGELARARMDAKAFAIIAANDPQQRIASNNYRFDSVDRSDYAVQVRTGSVLTSVVDGHQHSLDLDASWMETSYSVSSGAPTGHSHAWVREPDGSITIAVNEGHTHTLDGVSVEVSDRAISVPPIQRNKPRATENEMKTLEEQLKDANNSLLVAQKRVGELENEKAAEVKRADAAEGALEVTREKLVDAEKYRADGETLKDAEAKILVLTAELATEKQLRADAEDPDRRFRAVEERTKVVSVARVVLGDKYTCDNISDHNIRVAVVSKLGKAPDKDESEDKVKARFDERVSQFMASEAAVRAARENAIGETITRKREHREDTADEARRKMEERNRNGWRGDNAAK